MGVFEGFYTQEMGVFDEGNGVFEGFYIGNGCF
jgi:hypothetical protein